MTKIRIRKSRYHFKAASLKSAKDERNTSDAIGATASTSEKLPVVSLPDNLFSGVKITLNELKSQSLTSPTPVAEPKKNLHSSSSSSDVGSKNSHMKKKDKRKQRREEFIKKLETAKALDVEKKKAIQRSKTPVVGDMHLLRMALPSLLETREDNKPARNSSRGKLKKNMLTDVPMISMPASIKIKKLNNKKLKHLYELKEIKRFQLALKDENLVQNTRSAILNKMKQL